MEQMVLSQGIINWQNLMLSTTSIWLKLIWRIAMAIRVHRFFGAGCRNIGAMQLGSELFDELVL
jgi:hypothetical protein